MTTPTRAPANGFVAAARKVYNPLGFSKGYNFVYFFIFASALLGFSLARLSSLDFNGTFCSDGGSGTLPGECYWYKKSKVAEIGIRIHLIGVLLAGVIVVLQFIPAIRHKWILFHRVNGYLILLLIALGVAGALMITRHAAGGGLDTQAGSGFLSAVVVVELALAWLNIKRLRIDRHRAWMLRAWFMLGTPITTRLILIIAAQIISQLKNVYQVRPCGQIEYALQSTAETLAYYPECASNTNGVDPGRVVPVLANFSGDRIDQIMTALGAPFGMSLWLGMAIQAVGVEVYLQLTPKETARLRQVSHQRRLEAGYTNEESQEAK